MGFIEQVMDRYIQHTLLNNVKSDIIAARVVKSKTREEPMPMEDILDEIWNHTKFLCDCFE